MKEHIHLFKKVGGSQGDFMADIDYQCECSIRFKVEVPRDIYQEMPNEIPGKKPVEPIEVNLPDFKR